MLALASSDAEIVVRLEQLDADPYLLSCGNGTLDLRTGELREPDPADLITLGTDVDYLPDAPRERWLRFLDEVFDGDQELIAFVKRAYGSCATGDARDRALFIEYGSRFNGKSTLNRAVQHVLGDFAHTAPIRVVTRTRQAEIPNEIAALARKRLVDDRRNRRRPTARREPGEDADRPRQGAGAVPAPRMVLVRAGIQARPVHELPAESRRLRRRRLGSHPPDPVPRLVRRPRRQGTRREAGRREPRGSSPGSSRAASSGRTTGSAPATPSSRQPPPTAPRTT